MNFVSENYAKFNDRYIKLRSHIIRTFNGDQIKDFFLYRPEYFNEKYEELLKLGNKVKWEMFYRRVVYKLYDHQNVINEIDSKLNYIKQFIHIYTAKL